MTGPVLYVTTTFPTLACFVENEVHRLRARGVPVSVVTLRGVGRHYQPEHAALVPLTSDVGNPLDPRGWLLLLAWMARRPHVLAPAVARMLWASRGSAYALAGHVAYLPAAARVATAIERHGVRHVHGAWAHFPASVAWLAARLTGARFSMAAHAGSDLYRTRALLRDKARDAAFVTACVRMNAEMLRDLAGPGANVEWIYHGVDLARFDAAGRAPAPQPTLLCVGRLAPTKGFDDAIRTLALLRRAGHDARLTIVGEGPARAALEQLSRAADVSGAVTFTGSLDHAALLPHYRTAWMLLAPSRVLGNGRRDGIPNVVIEAMAMGVPVAATRAAGLEEAVVPGVTGVLAPPGDPPAMAETLAPLLADPVRLAAMGRAARARVVEQFDAAQLFERVWALFDAGSRRAPAAERSGAA